MNRIRELRELVGISAEALAEKVGTTTKQIYRLEQGSRRLTAQWMARIAEALHCSTADLLPRGASAEDEDDVELYAPEGDASTMLDAVLALGLRVFKVSGTSLKEAGIVPGQVITVAPVDDLAKLQSLDIVLVRMGKILVLRQFIRPALLITNKAGANLAIRVDDPVVRPFIEGRAVIGPQQGASERRFDTP